MNGAHYTVAAAPPGWLRRWHRPTPSPTARPPCNRTARTVRGKRRDFEDLYDGYW